MNEDFILKAISSSDPTGITEIVSRKKDILRVETGHSTETVQVESSQKEEKHVDAAGVPNLMLPLPTIMHDPFVTAGTRSRFDDFGNKPMQYETVKQAAQKKESLMILSMLETWSKSIEEITLLQRKELKVRSLQRDESIKENLSQEIHRREAIVDLLDALKKKILAEGGFGLDIPKGGAVLPLETSPGGILIAISHMKQISTHPGDDSRGTISFNAISEANQALAPFISEESRRAVELMATYFATMSMYLNPIIGPSVGRGSQVDKERLNAKFARSYAQEVLQLVQHPQVNWMMLTLIIKAEGNRAHEITPQELKEKIVIAKLVVLMTALALVYKLETGGLTSNEIEAFLRGKMQIEKDSVEAFLVKFIKYNLDLLPPRLATQVLHAMLNYLDAVQDATKLLKPARVLRKVFNATEFTAPERIMD